MEFFAFDYDPNFKAAFVIQMPSGASIEETEGFIMEPGTVQFYYGMLNHMVERGERFLWSDLEDGKHYKQLWLDILAEAA